MWVLLRSGKQSSAAPTRSGLNLLKRHGEAVKSLRLKALLSTSWLLFIPSIWPLCVTLPASSEGEGTNKLAAAIAAAAAHVLPHYRCFLWDQPCLLLPQGNFLLADG